MGLHCRSCKNTHFSNVLSLGNLYLSEFTKGRKKPPRYPLNLVLCTDCFLVQLKETTPPKLLYTDNYGYKSGINLTMQQELKDVVSKTLRKITPKKNILSVDIGANDGTLLSNYSSSVKTIAFEPVAKLAKECQKYADVVINDFFNAKVLQKKIGDKKTDIITIISCFYDIPNPNQFLQDITKILDENGIVVIQQNYLVGMLEQHAFDNIVHEHLEYYSMLSLQTLLKRHDLEIFDVKLSDINGGSFRTYINFSGKRKISKHVDTLLRKESALKLNTRIPYKTFAKAIRKTKKQLFSFIQKEKRKGKSIAVYGASTRGNTLLQYFNLDNALIDYAIERNPEKWGTNIASVGIPIISEDDARKKHPDYMLVLPWFFKEEFLKREKAYLKTGGHFIFPLPTFEII